MTYRPRPRLHTCGAAAWILFASLSNVVAAPADAVQGERLAKRWCASCHVVSADQMRGADNVPTFSAIARNPAFDAHRIRQFLMNPHPKMPDMMLTRDEARNLGAYIATLAR